MNLVRTRRRRGRTAAVAVLALAAGLLAPTPSLGSPQPPTPPIPDLDQIDPVRFDYDEASVGFQQVVSRNGVDRIWVDFIRPATAEPVPTILIASPYFNTLGRGWRAELKTPHFGPEIPTSPGTPALATGDAVPFPEWYDEYFVPRGYAVALMDLRGTRNTSGCQVYGDRDEVYDVVDVIDWIADQPWSNGKVGMTGGSYDGTVAIGAAVEQPVSGRHPHALGAIIPIRAIGRWYDYHFFNGVQSSSHQATPALFTAALAGADTQNAGSDDVLLPVHIAERKACIATLGALAAAGYASPYQDADAPFWAERDFIKDLRGSRTAMFVIHGLADFNVKTNNAGYLWESLPGRLPKKLWLMNGDHVDPHVPTIEDAQAGGHIMPFPFPDKFIDATHRWYLQFLKGVEAGALRTPRVEVQGSDGTWSKSTRYPRETRDLKLWLTPTGKLRTSSAPAGTVTFRDAPTGATSKFLVSAPMTADTHISGQLAFDLRLRAQGPDTTVAVTILAVPPGVSPTASPTDLNDGNRDRPLRVGYAWARAWYRDSIELRGLSTPAGGRPLVSGQVTPLRFGSLYTDIVVPKGHRIALRFGNAAGGTVAAGTGGNVDLLTGPGGSRVLVPVVAR